MCVCVKVHVSMFVYVCVVFFVVTSVVEYWVKGYFSIFKMLMNNERPYSRMRFYQHLFPCQGKTRILGHSGRCDS